MSSNKNFYSKGRLPIKSNERMDELEMKLEEFKRRGKMKERTLLPVNTVEHYDTESGKMVSEKMGIDTGIGLIGSSEKEKEEVVAELERLGFKALFPAELSEEGYKTIVHSDMDRVTYLNKLDRALIIDGKQPYSSLQFGEMILHHYFATDLRDSIGTEMKTIKPCTYEEKDNSITMDLGFIGEGEGKYKEGTFEYITEFLKELGFNPIITNENGIASIKISSRIPYITVQKSKFEQIYEKSKGKIKEMFTRLKSEKNEHEHDDRDI